MLPQISLSTMWTKGRFGSMSQFVAKAKELGFTHIEANASVSPQELDELIETSIPMGEVPIDLNLQDKLHQLYTYDVIARGAWQSHPILPGEYSQTRDELIHQRASQAPPCLEAARKSLEEISHYSQQQGIMLELETRFYFYEIPNIDEMEELLNASCHSERSEESRGAQDKLCEESVGYWHDMGHAEVNQRLGFTPHEEWLSRFSHKMIGIHLHDVVGISDHCPPGKGNMNWDMVAKYLPREAIRTCEIAEWNEEEEIQGVVSFLQGRRLL